MMSSAEPTPEYVALRDFDAFTATDGKRLQRALVAAYGPEDGADLYADAMLRAWSDWDAIGTMLNPAGYLWRGGIGRAQGRNPVTTPARMPSFALKKKKKHQLYAEIANRFSGFLLLLPM